MDRIGEQRRIGIRRARASDVLAAVRFKFPHFELIQSETNLDPEKIYFFLMRQDLLRRDASFEVGPYTFRLTDATYASPCERKRLKKDAPKTFVPVSESVTGSILSRRKIETGEVIKVIDQLNPGRVPACNNEIVVKGQLIALVKLLNRELLATTEHPMSVSRFDNNRIRIRVITDWINWLFSSKYKVESKYTTEQIRQMIKRTNITSGRFELVGPSFEAEFPEFYRQQ